MNDSLMRQPTIGEMMQFEQGEMEGEDVVRFACRLLNSLMVWTLPGSYGRFCQGLLDDQAVICSKSGKFHPNHDHALMR